jgi:hypothetical protein
MTSSPSPGELIAGLAGSLPDAVPADRLEIGWQRSLADRLAGRPGRPVRIRLTGTDLILVLASDDGRQARAEAIREVRGVVISRRALSVAEWLDLLGEQLHALAAASAADGAAVNRALTQLGVREPGSDLAVPDDDIAGGLRALPARLAGRVPDDVIAAVQRIGVLLLDTLSRLEGSQVPTAQSDTVRRAATDYLPTTLRRYVALPPDWAGGHDLGGGRTALDGLRAQLGTLERAATEMRDAALASDARALDANGLFLADRFANSQLDLP